MIAEPPHAAAPCRRGNFPSSASELLQWLREDLHLLGIASTPSFAPSTMPTATAREALSPPTIALATAAFRKSLYFRMKYSAPGRVPSVGEALPTLIGSLLPTSHSLAMEVRARSSTNSSFESGLDGSVASFTLALACFTLDWIHESLSAATWSTASSSGVPWSTLYVS